MKRTAITRRAPLRRSWMRRRSRSTSYARRPRDTAYMLATKQLPCAVAEDPPDPNARPTPCDGVIEADHLNSGALSHKSHDRKVWPMCHQHHVERTDHTGTFKHVPRAVEREWRTRQITRTQARLAWVPALEVAA